MPAELQLAFARARPAEWQYLAVIVVDLDALTMPCHSVGRDRAFVACTLVRPVDRHAHALVEHADSRSAECASRRFSQWLSIHMEGVVTTLPPHATSTLRSRATRCSHRETQIVVR